MSIEVVTYQQLVADPEQAFKNDQLKYLLNQKPYQKWLKPHPTATKKVTRADGTIQSVSAEYLPIDKVEFMLDRIFQEWKIEVKEVQVIFNSVCVTIRLHYKNPLTAEWLFHDGVGAKGLQLKAGSKASEMENIQPEAVAMAVPSAKSYAIKDAADHLGQVFGRDVNRQDVVDFVGAYSAPPNKEEDRLEKLILAAKTKSALEKFKNEPMSKELRDLYDEQWKKLA